MQRQRSPSRSRAVALAAAIAMSFVPRVAFGQACCAGSSALTPGRLALHEDALVGATVRVADGFGSIDGRGHYSSNPAGTSEIDLEQDLFGAVRFLRRGQVALLAPLVETYRRAPRLGSEAGGGIGDVNLSARWDFTTAGESHVIPGIGALAGLTLPTGTSPESATTPLATGATGVGAVQGNVGLALEQSFGPWLVNATGIVAKRFPRTAQGVHTALATQVTLLAAVAYTFENEAAVAAVVSYAFEGDATIDGQRANDSGRRLIRATASATYPLTDRLRLQGGVYFDPPIVTVDQNQTTTLGALLTAMFSWS